MNYTIGQMQQALSPNPFCLITSLREDGQTNVMALSWWTYVSNHPATVVICTSNKGLTGQNIRRTGEFTMCFPGASMAEKAMQCGCVSGHMSDKAAQFDIDLKDSAVVAPKHVAESFAVMECKLKDTKDVGDHTMYIAEVVETHLNPQMGKHLLSWEGYSRLDTL